MTIYSSKNIEDQKKLFTITLLFYQIVIMSLRKDITNDQIDNYLKSTMMEHYYLPIKKPVNVF